MVKKYKRVLSILLVFLMCFTLSPISVSADIFSFANMAAGGSVTGGGGGSNPGYINNLNSMCGYKVSIWYAPIDTIKSTRDNPKYLWNSGYEQQLGNTIYLRREYIELKEKPNTRVEPVFWNTNSIYQQSTKGFIWEDGYKKNPFVYYPTEFVYSVDGLDNNSIWDFQKTYAKWALSNLPVNQSDWTEGHKELHDFICRMYNMENPSNVDYTKINRDTGDYSGSVGRIMNSKESYQLPYTSAMKDGASKESVEYVKSYFLSPYVLNMISYVSRPDWSEEGLWSPEDFVTGELNYVDQNNNVIYHKQGQYKIFIEPIMIRPLNGKIGALTWRDMMLEHRAKGATWDCGSSVANIAVSLGQVANALKLGKPDDSLMYNGQLLQVTSDIKKDTEVAPMAMNNLNGLGVGVLDSPSLNSYGDPIDVIKTFVYIKEVKEDGTVVYEKAADTRMGPMAFKEDSNGNVVNIPREDDMLNMAIVEGTAVLNDIITTDKNLSINQNTEWTGELPTNIGDYLDLTADTIAGYRFGILTGSELFIESTITTKTGDSSVMTDEFFTQVAKDINSSETRAAGGYTNMNLEYIYFINPITGKPDYSRRSNKAKLTYINEADEYSNINEIEMGELKDGRPIKITEERKHELGKKVAANTIVLRYIVFPTARQINMIEVKNGTSTTILTCYDDLVISNETVTVQNPKHPDLEKYSKQPQLIRWVTNSELPIKMEEIQNNRLPNKSNEGKEGNSITITDYPVNKPITHNLYVHWVIELPPPGVADVGVPEWRLSKFFAKETDVPVGVATMSLPVIYGDHNYQTLSPSGNWNYKVINPNEKYADSGNQKLYSWLHSKAEKIDTASVSINNPSVMVNISGNVTAIKSTDTTGLKAAKWVTDSGTVNGLKNYDIQTGLSSTSSNSTRYTTRNLLNISDYMQLDFGVYNVNSYTNEYCVCHRGWNYHYDTYPDNYISTSEASYTDGIVKMDISFARYNQSSSRPALTVSPTVKNDNGYTTLKYQQDKTLNIYPEYGMLFDNDSNVESIKWMVSDQSRLVKPVIYQTLDYKVYVDSASTGTMATDSRAKTKAGSLGLGNLPVLYKGAPVNSTFKVYRDSNLNKAGIMTVKTFALDIDTNKVSYSDWGNNGYNGATLGEHNKLLSQIDTVGKATVTEKLLIDSPGYGSLDYTGGVRNSASNAYTKVDYSSQSNKVKDSSGKYTVCELKHKLIVRGGQVIGVEFQNRNTLGYTKYTMSQLKTADAALYDALVGMNLYNPSNDRTQTVLSTFEHKVGDSLTEDTYATMLASARQSVDGIVTPSNAAVSTGSGWYSEDSTVLVVKEYITNYTVPSIAVSDKISLQVNGLQTPVDKNQFFSAMGKGYLYLKYDLPISTSAGNANAYFEFTTISGDGLDSYGKQGVNYLVPNVSVSDTTRAN